MTKKELLPLAKQYFDNNKSLFKIYGTEDKHFFYEKIHAVKYCGVKKVFFTFTPEDFVVKVVPKPKPISQKEKQAEAKKIDKKKEE